MDLKQLRELAGLTQNRVARAIGMTRSRLSEIECGEIEPRPEEEDRLRRFLFQGIQKRQEQLEAAVGEPAHAT